MAKIARLANIGSRWDARYLVNTVMGLLCRQDNPDADTVMDVVTSAVRGYAKGYYGKSDHAKEEGVYRALKDYAWERIYRKGRDADLMEAFVNMTESAEGQIRSFRSDVGAAEKMFATFPLDCLGEGELSLFTERAWQRFRANFYQSDGTPGTGMLVFEDADGITAFTNYMLDNHSDLRYETKEEGSSL
jgi:hypothetical protein